MLNLGDMEKSWQSLFTRIGPALSPEIQIWEVGVSPRHLILGFIGD